MSKHLPECHRWFANMPEDGCPACEMFRACEQRVREEIDREAFVLDEGDPFRQVYRKGLDAAREAVAALKPRLKVEKYEGGYDCCGCSTTYDLMGDALAAIDALRRESDV